MRFWHLAQAAAPLALAAACSSSAQPVTGSVLEVGQNVAGELSTNDSQRQSGKFEDSFTIQGRAGERIEIAMEAEGFDTFLIVSGGEGYTLSNDDAAEGSTNSKLVLELPANGTYRVAATSFRPGATGTYRLAVRRASGNARVSRPEPAQAIRIGSDLTGALVDGDGQLGSGEYVDRYRFRARRGQRVTIDLASSAFDTYLILQRPDGTQVDVDDSRIDGAESTNSRIDTVLAEDGDYTVMVTSYAAKQEGKYTLGVRQSPGHPRHVNVAGGQRVIALLVGVSEYGGRTSDLANTDEDARQLYRSLGQAGLLHPASQVLTNADATTSRLRAAFQQAAAAAGPNDLFLFFFSGHGDQVDVRPSAAELDGRAETIELRDAAMTDAELGRLFAQVNARMALVAIDACYAGGFRNLVSRPGVMGLFSSEEDLTSLVAENFKAGGFLSYFLRSGISGGADFDGDRIISAGEMSTYVRRRFRREGDIPATTREEEGNFQNLVIERGGVHIEDVVVRLGQGTSGASAPTRPIAAGVNGIGSKQPGATARKRG